MDFIKKVAKLYFSRGFFVSGPQFISILVQLITLPIVLKALPVEQYGGYQFAFSVFSWLTLFSIGNITLGASRGIAIGKSGTFLFSFLYRLRIIIPLGLVTILSSYFFDTSMGMFQQLIFLVGGYLLIGYLPQVSFTGFFVATQQFKNYFVWQTILSSLTSIFAAVVAFYTHDVRIYTLVQFGSISLISICGFVWILIRNKIIESYKKDEIDRSVIKYGLSLIPVEIISGTSNQITSFVIAPLFGFAQLAVYSVASRIDAAVRNFLTSFYNVWYADFARKDFNELKKILHEKHLIIIMGSVLFSLVVAIPGFFYIKYAIPNIYTYASVIYVILASGFPAILLQTIFHTFLSSHLRHRALVFAGIIPSVIKIGCIALMGFFMGIMGIAIAVSFSAWVSFLFYYISVYHKNFLLSLVPKRFNKDAFDESYKEKESYF